jgi:hypothetical protein
LSHFMPESSNVVFIFGVESQRPTDALE